MGMIGTYLALDERKLKAIVEGKGDLFDLDPETCDTANVDKAWHAIWYLLCGSPLKGESQCHAVPMLEDQTVDCETDYGAFYLDQAQVKETSDYLNSLELQTIRDRYDFDAMVRDNVYPVMADEDPEEFYEYIISNLLELKKFYQEAAARDKAIIFFIM